MAEIYITVAIDEGGESLGSKTFLVNFSDADPAVWFANPIAWATQLLQPRADLLVLATQEAILAQRRADLEAGPQAPTPEEPTPPAEEPTE